MYRPGKNLFSSNLAGFEHYDGFQVLSELKVGTKLDLALDLGNPFDARAVEIQYKGKKLGFVPRGENRVLSKLLHFGHNDIAECYVNRLAPDASPEHQVGIVVRLVDNRPVKARK
jgi:hypothetical protein